MKHTFWKAVNARSIKEAVKLMDDWGVGIYDMFIVHVGPCYDAQGERVFGYVSVRIWGAEFPKEREDMWC